GVLSSAKKSPERSEDATRECRRFLREWRESLRKRPLLAAMHLACSGGHLVTRQINVVSRSGPHASGGGELIGNRADRRMRDRHGRLQWLSRIMVCRLVHHLCPDRQGQRGAVAVGDNRNRLIKSDPNPAR